MNSRQASVGLLVFTITCSSAYADDPPPGAFSGPETASPYLVFGFALAILVVVYKIFRQGSEKRNPPLNAVFLFYLFMTRQNCDAIVGDLEQRYRIIHEKFGRRRANFWFWTQTVMSVGSVVWAGGKKVSVKPVGALIAWALARGILDHDSWVTALVDFWKKVRSS